MSLSTYSRPLVEPHDRAICTCDMTCMIIHQMMHLCGAGHPSNTYHYFKCIGKTFPCLKMSARSIGSQAIGKREKLFD